MSGTPTPPRPARPTAVGAYGDDANFLRAREARRLRPLEKSVDKDGKVIEIPYDVPAWFRRLGLRTFEIDTGFGTAIAGRPGLKAVRRLEDADETMAKARAHHEAVVDAKAEAATIEAAAECLRIAQRARAAALVHYAINALLEIPESWVVELECPELPQAVVGQKIPAPSTVYGASAEAQEAYFSLLPPTLASQILEGLAAMNAVAPIPYDEKRTNPS